MVVNSNYSFETQIHQTAERFAIGEGNSRLQLHCFFVFFLFCYFNTRHKHQMRFHLLFSRVPLADYHDAKHTTRSMYLDLTKGRLLTCGGDRIVKVRNMELLANHCFDHEV